MTLWKDLIDIPEEVLKNDFVLKLTEGVERKEETVKTYVATEELAASFERALQLIRSAVDNKKSVAAYLHGSFGSGKSHFMAILSLILEGYEPALGIENLASAVRKHNEWRDNKYDFLMVPYHMMDARSMEQAIFDGYINYVRRHHPGATLPGVFVSERILKNANELRESMGDDTFFNVLNKAKTGAGGKWGKLEASWDVETYQRASEAEPGSNEQARLVGDVVSHLLTATVDTAKVGEFGYVSLDEGLSIISHHVTTLKSPNGKDYAGLILFLDELVLWLASRAGDINFINREGPKIAKLIEAQYSDRPTPIISFVARQRDLRDFLGAQHSGLQQFNVGQQLQYWDRGLDVINLEDRNLHVIVEKRLLKPKNAKAGELIAQSFEKKAKAIKPKDKDVMMTAEADEAMFSRVYPFSPVLVETLIGLSALLHRERTALRLMLTLLVNRRNELELGEIIPVGDLWDVVSDQQMPFSDIILQTYQAAQKLYRERLEPMLRRHHNLDAADPVTRPFKNDDRIVKTLLMSALVPGVNAFKDLKADKLLALNHGAVTAPVPGAETQAIIGKLRQWAAEIGEIRLSSDSIPTVSLQLSSIDMEGLLARVNQHDNEGNRRRKIKELIYDWMGLQGSRELFDTHSVKWRGAIRKITIAYRNIREMPLSNLESEDGKWKLVIDFPFDDDAYSPGDDTAKLNDFRQHYPDGTDTLAWLPSFLSSDGRKQLGRLVMIDYILSRFDTEAAHLSPTDRPTVNNALQSQQNAIRMQMRSALETAYGLNPADNNAVDPTLSPSSHLESLRLGFNPRPPGGVSFAVALDKLAAFMLQAMYPAAPDIPDDPVSAHKAQKMAEVIIQSIEAADKRALVEDKNLRRDLKNYAERLDLGHMGETHFSWSEHWRNEIDRGLESGDGAIGIHEIHRIIEPDSKPRGLPEPLRDLIVVSYAAMKNLVFKVGGQSFEAKIGKIDDRAELHTTRLPNAEAWQAGSKTAQTIFGIEKTGQLVNARNVEKLLANARTNAESKRSPIRQLPEKLVECGVFLGLTRKEIVGSRRHVGASVLNEAAAHCDGSATEFVESLASMNLSNDDLEAAQATFERVTTHIRVLESTSWNVFKLLEQHGGKEQLLLLKSCRDVLLGADWVKPLEQFNELEKRAWKLIPPPPASAPPGIKIDVSHEGTIEEFAERVATALKGHSELDNWLGDARVRLQITVTRVDE